MLFNCFFLFIIYCKDIFQLLLNIFLLLKFWFWHKCRSIEFELFFMYFLDGRDFFRNNNFTDEKNKIFPHVSFSFFFGVCCDGKINFSDCFLIKEFNDGSFVVFKRLKFIKFELSWEVVNWWPECAGLISDGMFDWFWQKKGASQTDHEHKSQERLKRLRWRELEMNFIFPKILIHISKHWSIMIRIKPWPWWESNKVVLTIELKPFNVGFYNSFIFGVSLYIFNTESGFVIFVSTFCNVLVLYLKVLNILWELVDVLNVVSIAVIFLFVISGHLNHVLWSAAFSLQNHLFNHFCLKSLTYF